MKLFRKKEPKKNILKEQPKTEETVKSNKTGFYSDKGRRQNQEDSYLITKQFKNRQLILVADGVGGQEYGEFASNKAIEIFKNFFVQSQNFESAESFLTRTALIAASMLMNKATENPEYNNSATTLTGFMLIDDEYYTINIGDSRVYLFSNDKLTRKTKDHSYVQFLVDNGGISLEEARTHPKKNLVTSVISSNISDLKTSVEGPFSIQKDDILIACSDGVHDALADKEIEKIIRKNSNSDNLAEILGKAAYKAGSKDNITVCFLKY